MPAVGIGVGVDIGIVSGGFSAAYQTVYDSFSNPPPDAIAEQQDIMVSTLVDADIWSKLDVFYLFANFWPADGLLNWPNPGTNNSTAVNTPGFISYEGYSGNATDEYLTSYNPGDGGTHNLKVADACVFTYTRVNETGGTRVFYGAHDGANSIHYFPNLSAVMYYRMNSDTNGSNTGLNPNTGFILNNRNGAAVSCWRNGADIDTDTVATTSIPNLNIFILARNESGSPDKESLAQMSVYGAGSNMSNANKQILQDAIEVYMDSNSKGVIT